MKHDWEYKQIMDVGKVVTGSTPSTSDKQNYTSNDVCFVKPSDIGQDGITEIQETEYHISEYAYNNTNRKLPRGSVLVTCIGIIGKVGILTKEATCNQQINAVIPNNTIMPRYLAYSLYSIRKALQDKANAPVVPILNKGQFSSFQIPVPPLSVQEHICSLLDNLNLVIEKKKEQIAELDNLAQSLFYDMFGDPTTNEKGWDIVEMRTLFDIGSSKRVFESQWTDEGVPFYRAREIVRLSRNEPIESPIFISEPLFKEYSTKYGIPSEGDIMVTAVGTLGVCYLVKKTDRFYFKDGNLLWFRDKGVCDTRFIKDQFTTDYVRNQIQGNANAAVVGTYTITNANKTMVVLPPLDFQKEYVRKVEAIDRQKELINQSIKDVQTLFDAKMDYYFGD